MFGYLLIYALPLFMFFSDREATASVMARLSIHSAETCYAWDVIKWLDNELIHFVSKFGNYMQEDP